jgi:prepilin-type N-terminal cleavage/methylation domain-containing protein
MIKKFLNKRGLTLVELMVAVAILGVLVTAVTNVFMVQMRSAKLQDSIGQMNSELASTMAKMKKAIMLSPKADRISVMEDGTLILGIDFNSNGTIETAMGSGAWQYESEIIGWRLNPAADPANDSNMNIQVYSGPFDGSGDWKFFAGQQSGASEFRPQMTDLKYKFYDSSNEITGTKGSVMTIEIMLKARVKNPNPEIDEYKEREIRLSITPYKYTGL